MNFGFGALTLALVFAQAPTDPFAALRVFEGKWEGKSAGVPGKGVSTREYRFEMGGRFLSVRNKSVWEPAAPEAKGEVHEDFGMFSFDKALKKVVLRQFHIEGFVNEYTLDSAGADGKTLEFVTVRIENIAPGWRARERYVVHSKDEITETFLLAAPGKDFEVYSETRLRRSR